MAAEGLDTQQAAMGYVLQQQAQATTH
jgi:hypothetical protein